jgi:hypothetical protein
MEIADEFTLTMVHSEKVAVESALLFETPAEIFGRVFRHLRPRTSVPEIEVHFCPFANANSFVRYKNRQLCVRITDLLASAPAPVLEALAYILLCKLFRRTPPPIYTRRYRLYLNRRDVRHTLQLVRQSRGRKYLSDPRGRFYDLNAIFGDLNDRYFSGLLTRPILSWSQGLSRTILGHYDASHNAIIISRLLDRDEVPRFVVEYILFHEMLHLRYPEEHKGTLRRVHTRSFKEAEKNFLRLQEAKEWIKQL